MMRIAIVGSRDYPNRNAVRKYINELPDDTIVVSGGARGVDTWAEQIARSRGLGVLVFCIPNGHYTTRQAFADAARTRNQRIVDHADQVVAFHYRNSPGTRSTIIYAQMRGKPVTIYNDEC